MKKLFIPIWALLLCAAANVAAETVETRNAHKHEIRFGVGDAVLNRLFIGPHDLYESKNLYTAPNLFLEYQYRLNTWCGLGLQVNGAWWGADMRERVIQETVPWEHIVQAGISVMPTARFTYFHREWVNLYSSVSLGYFGGINTTDGKTRYSHGAVGNVCFLGVSVGRNHFFGAGEIGVMCGGTNDVLQIGSRLLSISLGYRL